MMLFMKCLFHEILYADELVLVGDSIEGIRRKFENCKDSLESKGSKNQHLSTKIVTMK